MFHFVKHTLGHSTEMFLASLHSSPASEGQYWEFLWWWGMWKRAGTGERCLQTSLVLRHCHTGLWRCHFPSCSLTQIHDLSFFIYFICFYSPPVAFFTDQNLYGKTQRTMPGPWGLLAESVVGKELPAQGFVTFSWQHSIRLGGRPGKHPWAVKNSPDLLGCTGGYQGGTPRWFTCSASPFPLVCIFCSTELSWCLLYSNVSSSEVSHSTGWKPIFDYI